MNQKYLEKLEFNKIIEILSTFCSTSVGKDIVLTLKPSHKKEEVSQKLSETYEAVNLSYKNNFPSFHIIYDITNYLKILEIYGILPLKGLLTLIKLLIQADDLKKYYNKDFINNNDYPLLTNIFNNLYSNIGIVEKVSNSIIDENTIDDKASPTLYSIRRKKRKIEQDIKDKLNKILHSSSTSKYIQESIVTIRNNRFVVPVKEEFRTQVKGFIHDISNAGATVFIEPTAIFELNNELNNLKIEENIEIEKILQELTILFYPYITDLKSNLELIGKLDFIFAKAKYSNSINGITPKINDEKCLNLIHARHPLIDNNKVVPISINLGNSFCVLVITGPNTGGKTVSLKTVGLLEIMACSRIKYSCR